MSRRDTLRRVLARVGLGGGADEGPVEHLKIVVNPAGDFPILQLAGELDHHAAERVRRVVQKLLEEPEVEAGPGASAQETDGAEEPSLVLDLDELSYIDSGGLALFFDVARAFEESGQGYLGILNPNLQVRRLLEISGLGEVRRVRILTPDENPPKEQEGGARARPSGSEADARSAGPPAPDPPRTDASRT
jgi:anti-anti-sigma regulatory factor